MWCRCVGYEVLGVCGPGGVSVDVWVCGVEGVGLVCVLWIMVYYTCEVCVRCT